MKNYTKIIENKTESCNLHGRSKHLCQPSTFVKTYKIENTSYLKFEQFEVITNLVDLYYYDNHFYDYNIDNITVEENFILYTSRFIPKNSKLIIASLPYLMSYKGDEKAGYMCYSFSNYVFVINSKNVESLFISYKKPDNIYCWFMNNGGMYEPLKLECALDNTLYEKCFPSFYNRYLKLRTNLFE